MSTMLIADDSSFMRSLIADVLCGEEFQLVAVAATGEEAVQMFRVYRPQLVVMDVNMPGMSGVEAVQVICKEVADACVVMVSSMGQPAIMKEAIISGASGFVIKPFTRDKLLAEVHGALSRIAQRQGMKEHE